MAVVRSSPERQTKWMLFKFFVMRKIRRVARLSPMANMEQLQTRVPPHTHSSGIVCLFGRHIDVCLAIWMDDIHNMLCTCMYITIAVCCVVTRRSELVLYFSSVHNVHQPRLVVWVLSFSLMPLPAKTEFLRHCPCHHKSRILIVHAIVTITTGYICA